MGDHPFLIAILVIGIAGAVTRRAHGGEPHAAFRRSVAIAVLCLAVPLLGIAAAMEISNGLWVAAVWTAVFAAVMIGLVGIGYRRRT
jgi:hypothetical protein